MSTREKKERSKKAKTILDHLILGRERRVRDRSTHQAKEEGKRKTRKKEENRSGKGIFRKIRESKKNHKIPTGKKNTLEGNKLKKKQDLRQKQRKAHKKIVTW